VEKSTDGPVRESGFDHQTHESGLSAGGVVESSPPRALWATLVRRSAAGWDLLALRQKNLDHLINRRESRIRRQVLKNLVL
jgi:hypothetical protein